MLGISIFAAAVMVHHWWYGIDPVDGEEGKKLKRRGAAHDFNHAKPNYM